LQQATPAHGVDGKYIQGLQCRKTLQSVPGGMGKHFEWTD